MNNLSRLDEGDKGRKQAEYIHTCLGYPPTAVRSLVGDLRRALLANPVFNGYRIFDAVGIL